MNMASIASAVATTMTTNTNIIITSMMNTASAAATTTNMTMTTNIITTTGMMSTASAVATIMTTNITIIMNMDIITIIMQMRYLPAGVWRRRLLIPGKKSKQFWTSWQMKKTMEWYCVQKAWYRQKMADGFILIMYPKRKMSA